MSWEEMLRTEIEKLKDRLVYLEQEERDKNPIGLKQWETINDKYNVLADQLNKIRTWLADTRMELNDFRRAMKNLSKDQGKIGRS